MMYSSSFFRLKTEAQKDSRIVLERVLDGNNF